MMPLKVLRFSLVLTWNVRESKNLGPYNIYEFFTITNLTDFGNTKI